MKKYLLIGLVSLLSMNKSNAQDYYHGFGAQIIYGIYKQEYTTPYVNYSGVSAAAVPSLFYKASLDFSINRSTGFAITAYPSLGLSLTLNSQTGGSGSFGANLPILGEIHFGDLDDACFFAGAGFSIAYLSTIGFGSGSILGPQVGLGGQFNLRDRLMGLRASYTYGVNKSRNVDPEITVVTDKRSMITFGLYYPLGQ